MEILGETKSAYTAFWLFFWLEKRVIFINIAQYLIFDEYNHHVRNYR